MIKLFELVKKGSKMAENLVGSGIEGISSVEGVSTVENLSLENVDYIKSIEGLQHLPYEMSSLAERMQSLRTLETRMAEIQGRPPVRVVFEEMDSAGFYVPSEQCLHVNIEHVKDPRYRLEVIDTIAHEGQHALQHFAVEHPELFPHLQDVIPYWRANMANAYFEPKYIGEVFGPEFYYNQPLELNAWERGMQIRQLFDSPFKGFDSVLESGIAKIEVNVQKSFSESIVDWVQDAGERLRDYFRDICSPANLRIAARAGLISLTHHRV